MQQDENTNWVTAQPDIYCEIREPGYAILIDAPWGSGKTFGIKKWAANRTDTVYVSLYGVSSHEQFEVRLLEAIFYKDRSLRTPKLAKAVDGIASRVSGSSLGIAELYRRVALRAAPRIVIVDDLERVSLEANEVFGLINSLLEHEGRNLILIAYQDELKGKWGEGSGHYQRIKEKVIGRILPFYPDAEEALSCFIAQVRSTSLTTRILNLLKSDGPERYASWLSSETDFLVSVFNRLEIKNLRVFRQSIRDFGQIFPMLVELVADDREKMRLVLGSYLVLTTLYHSGRFINESALTQDVSWGRFAWRANGEKGEEPPKEPIEIAREMFLGMSEVVLDGSIVSGDLAVRCIAKGDFTAAFIKQELLKSPHLVESKITAWRNLWHWTHEAPSVVASSLRNVCDSLAAREYRDPVIIVHVFCILRSMEERGVKLPLKSSLENYFVQYVSDLLAMRLPELAIPKSAYGRSIVDLNNTGLGFAKEDGEFFKWVVAYLESQMDEAFWVELRGDPQRVMSSLRSDPREFLRSIDNRGRDEGTANYAHLPIIAFLKPEVVLEEMLKLGPGQVGTFISIIERRVERLNQIELNKRTFEWPDEGKWMEKFAAELKKKSEGSEDSIVSAQLNLLFQHCEDALGNLAKKKKK